MTQPDAWTWRRAIHKHPYVFSAAPIVFLLATGDLIFACGYWHAARAVPPSRLIQNIASGLLGRRAFDGGNATVLLGLLLQYSMIALMVGAYYLFSQRIKALNARPWAFGSLYGVVLYAVMNHVVVPLSAAAPGPVIASWIALSVLVHVIIGLSVAHGACWAARTWSQHARR